jgi:hypothetical protein
MVFVIREVKRGGLAFLSEGREVPFAVAILFEAR